jgi:hypothetical protein
MNSRSYTTVPDGRARFLKYYVLTTDTDVVDTATRRAGDDLNLNLANSLGHGFSAPAKVKSSNSGIHQLQAKSMLELMSVDRKGATKFFKYWEKLVRGQTATQHMGFSTLAEYLPHRRINVGETCVRLIPKITMSNR